MAFTDRTLETFLNSVISTLPSNSKYYDDPTTMGFTLFFEFEGADSPLFNESENGESAIRYLKNIGENRRAAHLKRFKTRLYDITRYYPYFFQKIKGLEGLYKFENSKPLDPKTLVIDTLESIDLRIGSLVSEYMDAFYDIEFRREMIPINLMRFKCHILVSEIKSFRTFVGENSGLDKDEMNMARLDDFLSYYWLTFRDCNFDFSNSLPFMGELAVTPETASGQFSIFAPTFVTRNKMRILDLYQPVFNDDKPVDFNKQNLDTRNQNPSNYLEIEGQDDGFTNLGGFLKNKAKNYAQNSLDTLASVGKSVLNSVEQTAETFVRQKGSEYLGKYDPVAKLEQLAVKGIDYLDSYLKEALFSTNVRNEPKQDKDLGNLEIKNSVITPTITDIDITNEESGYSMNADIDIANDDLAGLKEENIQINNESDTEDIENIKVSNDILDSEIKNIDIRNKIEEQELVILDTKNNIADSLLKTINTNNEVSNSEMKNIGVSNNIDEKIEKSIPVWNLFDESEFKKINLTNSIIPDDLNKLLTVSNVADGNINKSVSVANKNTVDNLNKFDKTVINKPNDDSVSKNLNLGNSDIKDSLNKNVNPSNESKLSKLSGFVNLTNDKKESDLNKKINLANKESDNLDKSVVVGNELVDIMKTQIIGFEDNPVSALINETKRANLGEIAVGNKIVE